VGSPGIAKERYWSFSCLGVYNARVIFFSVGFN